MLILKEGVIGGTLVPLYLRFPPSPTKLKYLSGSGVIAQKANRT
jgi:hypothetical protein